MCITCFNPIIVLFNDSWTEDNKLEGNKPDMLKRIKNKDIIILVGWMDWMDGQTDCVLYSQSNSNSQ